MLLRFLSRTVFDLPSRCSSIVTTRAQLEVYGCLPSEREKMSLFEYNSVLRGTFILVTRCSEHTRRAPCHQEVLSIGSSLATTYGHPAMTNPCFYYGCFALRLWSCRLCITTQVWATPFHDCLSISMQPKIPILEQKINGSRLVDKIRTALTPQVDKVSMKGYSITPSVLTNNGRQPDVLVPSN